MTRLRRPLVPLLLGAYAVTALSCDSSSLPPLPENPPFEITPLFDRCAETDPGCEDLPARVYAPEDYRPSKQYPLIVLLHGYTAAGLAQNLYFGLSRVVTSEQFILVIPDGTTDEDGNRFWNATPRCCDFYDTGRDDAGYLMALIDETSANYRVDPDRIYFFGHSNGGYMSFRMACQESERIAAIASLAGATFFDPADCEATEPVSVLAIHGTADDDVLYEGGVGPGDRPPYPGAIESVERFAGRAGCDLEAFEIGENLDLDKGLPGEESTVRRYREGCARGVDAELWSIVDGAHQPDIYVPEFSERVVQWLLRHRR